MLDRLNHVAIAVPHLGRAAALYAGTFGAAVSAPQRLPDHGVSVVFVTLANSKIELIEPLGDTSPIADFLARNPQGGIHHICYEVPDLLAARDVLHESGLRVLGDGTPKLGAHGLPVLFLHPKDALGTLIELEQSAPDPAVAHDRMTEIPSMDRDPDPIATIAERHDLSEAAVRALAEALQVGQGGAQWSHVDLGGMGQWSGGGMLQIGDMFNAGLKAKVAAALRDLQVAQADAPAATPPSRHVWWPAGLGTPSASGAQNAMRYACFPDKRRLAVDRDGRITLYDTGDHRITGVGQQQGDGRPLTFTGPDGAIAFESLKVVGID